ncbi:MAG TPA: OmpA family protein [Longimicrobiales bacterium]|nr:OmpA family protein [Longimicrobiales bacterium]
MTNTIRNSASVLAIAALLSGCAGLNQTQRGAVIGGAAGAAVGAAVGSATGSTARGAIIGAAVGGTAGAVIGAQMDRQRAELAAELEGARVERYGEGLLITFDSGLLFGFDSDVVTGAAQTNLTNLANSLRRHPDTEVLIVGHTDNVGSAQYNQGLSERRANSARNFLVSQGVPADRIRTQGMGLREPVASNETEAGRSQNRRVEVAIFASEEYRQELLRRHGGQ